MGPREADTGSGPVGREPVAVGAEGCSGPERWVQAVVGRRAVPGEEKVQVAQCWGCNERNRAPGTNFLNSSCPSVHSSVNQ
jgi:hypothetical protein